MFKLLWLSRIHMLIRHLAHPIHQAVHLPTTIRSRLFLGSFSLVLFMAVLLAAISSLLQVNYGRRQVIDKLESVATLKEAELNNWAAGLRSDLSIALIGTEAEKYAIELLSPSGDQAYFDTSYRELHTRFSQILSTTGRFDELFLMNLQRQVILSTDTWREGEYGAPESNVYFQKALKGAYIHPPSYTLSVGGIAIIVARPVLNSQGKPVGILIGRTSPQTLNEIMLERSGLGGTGETYLVTSSHIMLSAPRFPEPRWGNVYYVFTTGSDTALDMHQNGSSTYKNYRKAQVIGVYHWLPELEIALLAEQDEEEAMQPTFTSLSINLVLAAVCALIAAALSLLLANSITIPLSNLAKATSQIQEGIFQGIALPIRQDEIGVLTQAFNRMAVRLHELINNLEEQVIERTASLQRRALQLEISTKVSREITSILDTTELLARVANLIKQAFGYYHVGIYLLEKNKSALAFMAGSGSISEQWKLEAKKLPVGNGSINGEVALRNQAMLANNIDDETNYKPEASLPDTRSELVVPLRIGDRVLGTLDVQSTERNAFRKEDIDIIQSLGDQVAIAIENAWLYDRVRLLATLEERQRVAQELHDSVTQSLYGLVLFSGAGSRALESGNNELTMEYMQRIALTANQALKEMRLLLFQLRTTAMEREGLIEAIRQRLQYVEDRLGVSTEFNIEGKIPLLSSQEEALYGIAQEALNNILRHADAKSVIVSIRGNDGWVELDIVDDGVGFDLEAAGNKGGFGILGMRERAQKLNGSLWIETEHGKGTRVVAIIPYGNPVKTL